MQRRVIVFSRQSSFEKAVCNALICCPLARVSEVSKLLSRLSEGRAVVVVDSGTDATHALVKIWQHYPHTPIVVVQSRPTDDTLRCFGPLAVVERSDEAGLAESVYRALKALAWISCPRRATNANARQTYSKLRSPGELLQRDVFAFNMIHGTMTDRGPRGHITLSRADLRSCNISRACLRECNLEQTDLREVEGAFVDLSSAHLCGADLRGAVFVGSNFSGTRFGHAVLRDAEFVACDFRGSHLRSEALVGTYLVDCTFDSGVVVRQSRCLGLRLPTDNMARPFVVANKISVA